MTAREVAHRQNDHFLRSHIRLFRPSVCLFRAAADSEKALLYY
jgi:hypothetical protein